MLRLCTVTLLCLLSLVAAECLAQWPQQSCSHPHRIPVTITATGSNHNSETRLDLTDSHFPSSYGLSAAGDDVRVFAADDLTPVDFAVTAWDSLARTATIYVRLPNIPAGASETINLYLGDNSLPPASNDPVVFPDVGVRLHSRVSSADPTSAATGLAAFANATSDVDNSVRVTISGLNNRALGGANGNYGWCVSAVLNVTAATAGSWGFRYGGDFGRGGHLYVSGQPLEEDWNDDLWWAGNYGNTAETLEGNINLAAGWHRYEALGFEGCCDGATGFQARAPGGPWLDLASTNFSLRATQCIASTASLAIGAAQSCTTLLEVSKSAAVDASSESTFAIPGAIVRYEVLLTNPGQMVDANTLVLTDLFPSEVAVVVTGTGAFAFTDGAVASGLGYSYGGPADNTDSVEFSINGTDFSYTPTAPADDAVTHIRFRPTGIMNPNDGGDIPSFSISILGQVK